MPKIFASIVATLGALAVLAIGATIPAFAYVTQTFPATSGEAPASIPSLAIGAALVGLLLVATGGTALARRRS